MTYFERLQEIVLNNSYAKTYNEATTEWVTTYYDEESGTCLCGKWGLKHRYEITNVKTGNILFPIGSECIEKFNNEKMTKEALILKEIAEFRNDFLSFKGIKLNELNPNLVNYCYGEDIFDNEEDFDFMLMLSRKRSFNNLSYKQKKKAEYLKEKMENAILYDPAFYENEKEIQKVKELKENFIKEHLGKFIKAEDIPALIILHLPINIFDNPEQKDFMISMYRKIKQGKKNKMTEKQQKYLMSLMMKKVLPYLKKITK